MAAIVYGQIEGWKLQLGCTVLGYRPTVLLFSYLNWHLSRSAIYLNWHLSLPMNRGLVLIDKREIVTRTPTKQGTSTIFT